MKKARNDGHFWLYATATKSYQMRFCNLQRLYNILLNGYNDQSLKCN